MMKKKALVKESSQKCGNVSEPKATGGAVILAGKTQSQSAHGSWLTALCLPHTPKAWQLPLQPWPLLPLIPHALRWSKLS